MHGRDILGQSRCTSTWTGDFLGAQSKKYMHIRAPVNMAKSSTATGASTCISGLNFWSWPLLTNHVINQTPKGETPPKASISWIGIRQYVSAVLNCEVVGQYQHTIKIQTNQPFCSWNHTTWNLNQRWHWTCRYHRVISKVCGENAFRNWMLLTQLIIF